MLLTCSKNHLDDPYPTKEEKIMLASKTQLSLRQITNWFVNHRGRKWKEKKRRKKFSSQIKSKLMIEGLNQQIAEQQSNISQNQNSQQQQHSMDKSKHHFNHFNPSTHMFQHGFTPTQAFFNNPPIIPNVMNYNLAQLSSHRSNSNPNLNYPQ